MYPVAEHFNNLPSPSMKGRFMLLEHPIAERNRMVGGLTSLRYNEVVLI
jgi:hypothetical protein